MSEESLAFPGLPSANALSRFASQTATLSNYENEQHVPFRSSLGAFYSNSSRHSSYSSHSSHISYTSHGDIYGRLGFSSAISRAAWQRECQLRARRRSHVSTTLWVKAYRLACLHSRSCRFQIMMSFTMNGLQMAKYLTQVDCNYPLQQCHTRTLHLSLINSHVVWLDKTLTCKVCLS